MKTIYLIDWNNFIYRMFFALPEFKTKDWEIINALFGMAKFFVSTLPNLNPDYIVFIKDAKWENFRHKLYSDYKATRDKMPDNLRTQVPLIEEMIAKMDIPLVEIEGCEADDVIGTLANTLWQDKNTKIEILSWDKDLYSLVSNNIKIYDTMKKKKFWPAETKEKFGVESNMIIDYLAIIWDKSDNIPWIDGFGPQKAVALINNIWWVEEIYALVDKIDSWEEKPENYPKEVQTILKWKAYEKLKEGRDNAFLSKELATIKKDIELKDFNLENYKFNKDELSNDDIREFFEKYEFNSLLDWEWIKDQETWKDLNLKVHTIDNDSDLAKLKEACLKEKQITIDTETTDLDIIVADLVWISIYLDDKRIYYINRLHSWPQVSDESLKNFLNTIFNSDLMIVWHNLKYDLEILDTYLNSEQTKEKSAHNNSEQISFGF